MKVLLTDRAWPDCRIEREILAEIGAEVVEPPASDEETLKRFAGDVDAIGTCWAPVTAAVIEASPGCRIIARFGIGLDNIDLATATKRRIPVTNVPDYCVEEVADHALALILACARKIAFYHHRAKQQEYQLQAGAPMHRLSGAMLGIVGLGRIGQRLAQKAQGIGLNVVAATASGSDHGTGCPILPLDELLAQCDFVSLHLPLNEKTRRLIDAGRLAKMRPTAYLINTSRGGLIDHQALWHALKNNRIAGAALDVFDPEPPDLSLPLFQDERVIITPHAAFLSAESLRELRTRAARQIAQALSGARPDQVVNPDIYEDASYPANQ